MLRLCGLPFSNTYIPLCHSEQISRADQQKNNRRAFRSSDGTQKLAGPAPQHDGRAAAQTLRDAVTAIHTAAGRYAMRADAARLLGGRGRELQGRRVLHSVAGVDDSTAARRGAVRVRTESGAGPAGVALSAVARADAASHRVHLPEQIGECIYLAMLF